jgi:hypothetical protein
MLLAISLLLVLSRWAESTESLWIRKALSLAERICPQLDPDIEPTSPIVAGIARHFFQCAVAFIAIYSKENLGKLFQAAIAAGIMFIAAFMMTSFDKGLKPTVVMVGWAIVAIQCYMDTSANIMRKDPEILLMCLGPVLAHLAAVWGIELLPNIH